MIKVLTVTFIILCKSRLFVAEAKYTLFLFWLAYYHGITDITRSSHYISIARLPKLKHAG